MTKRLTQVHLDRIDATAIAGEYLTDQYSRFVEHRFLLLEPQWIAICLVFRDQLSLKEAGLVLGIGPKAVGERIRRAKKRMEDHVREIRREETREKLKLVRQMDWP